MKQKALRAVSVAIFIALCAAPLYLLYSAHRQGRLDNALILAVNKQDARRVDILLTEGADPNTRDPSYRSPPWYYGLLYVLHLRKRPAFTVYPGPTPLMVAAYNGDVATVRMLLAHRANPNMGGRYNVAFIDGLYCVPIGNALEGSVPFTTQGFANGPASLQIITLLLAHGANPNGVCLDQARQPFPVLGLAAGTNQTSAALILLLHGADPNRSPALGSAVSYSNVVLVKALLAHGAKVNTSMLFDIQSGDPASLQIAQILISRGADINACNGIGETLLLADERTHDMRLLAFLVKAGANPNIKDSQGQTALTYGSPDEVTLIRALQKPGTLIPHRLLAQKKRIISYAASF